MDSISSFYSYIQSLQTQFKGRWNSLSEQDRKVAGIVAVLLSVGIWITVIYNLHKIHQI